MKITSYGRPTFSASAVLFGIIALLWHDPATWQTLWQLWSLPHGRLIGVCLMAAQIAAGIALLHPRSARPASIILAVVYSLFSLVCLPGIASAPAVYAHYESFTEQFSLFCGALALFAGTLSTKAGAALFTRLARLGLGLCAISFTLAQIFYFRFTASLVPTWIPPSQTFWAALTTVAFALAAAAILIHRHERLALRLITLMLALFGLLVWLPLLIAHPQSHSNWSEFALTFLITGAYGAAAELPSR